VPSDLVRICGLMQIRAKVNWPQVKRKPIPNAQLSDTPILSLPPPTAMGGAPQRQGVGLWRGHPRGHRLLPHTDKQTTQSRSAPGDNPDPTGRKRMWARASFHTLPRYVRTCKAREILIWVGVRTAAGRESVHYKQTDRDLKSPVQDERRRFRQPNQCRNHAT